jgi:hypothetical protein
VDKTGLTISKELMERLKEEYEKRKIELRQQGINSVTSWVVHIVNQWISNNPPRFRILNHDSNLIRIKDSAENMVAEVIFSDPDRVFCSLCRKSKCIHVMYVLSQPDVVEELRKRGWRGEDYLD